MRPGVNQTTKSSYETQARRVIDLVIAVMIALAAAAALTSMAVMNVSASHQPPADERACMAAAANDEHASLEAFFANPTQENALAQIEARCSPQGRENAQ
jgi:hypothetical protein